MSISSALEKFESLSSCSDVIKVTKTSGTLAELFEGHKTDFIASDNAHTTIIKLCAQQSQQAVCCRKQQLRKKSLQMM